MSRLEARAVPTLYFEKVLTMSAFSHRTCATDYDAMGKNRSRHCLANV